jgi:hypothetical protein
MGGVINLFLFRGYVNQKSLETADVDIIFETKSRKWKILDIIINIKNTIILSYGRVNIFLSIISHYYIISVSVVNLSIMFFIPYARVQDFIN